MTPRETWRLHEGTDETCDLAIAAGRGPEELVAAGVRAGPRELPEQVEDFAPFTQEIAEFLPERRIFPEEDAS